MITTTIIVFIILSFIFGGIIAWFVATSRYQRKNAELEKRASGAEAIVIELRQQVQQRDSDINQIRNELDVEKQSKVEALTKLDASQKSFEEQKALLEEMKTERTDTLNALS